MSKTSEKKAAAQAALKDAQNKAAEAAAAAAATDANEEHRKAAEDAAAAAIAAKAAADAAASQDEDERNANGKPYVMTEEDWIKGVALVKSGEMPIDRVVQDVATGCSLDPIEVRKEFDRRLNLPDATITTEAAASIAAEAATSSASASETSEPAGEKILCQVPASFKVMIRHGELIDVPAGTNWLPREVSDHWYSKQNGLVIVPPQSPN